MARYVLRIQTPNPWTGSRTIRDFDGVRRARFDAIHLQMRKAIYDAMDSASLRDRPIAHELMRKANAWTKAPDLGHVGSVSVNGWGFYITRES